jgi:hypothetical protein
MLRLLMSAAFREADAERRVRSGRLRVGDIPVEAGESLEV